MKPAIHREIPRLLVPWESPGKAFLEAIGPALSRSPRLLKTERGYTGVPGQAVFASTLMQGALLILFAVLMPLVFPIIPSFRSLPPDSRVYKLTYLPTVSPDLEDNSGAEEGLSGAAGGKTAYHPVQVIRVAQGRALVAMVYQPPKIAMPRASSGFMNLLVVPPKPAVPLPEVPVGGLHSRVAAPVPVDVVPPPPRVENVAATRTQLSLPAPVPPPIAGVTGLSGRVSRIPADEAPPLAKTVLPGVIEGLPGTTDAGFLLSSIPGNVAAAPAEPHPGTLAMAPNGKGLTGAGGSGGGAGTGKGAGPGSGTSGSGPGADAAGGGYGADKLAHGGTAAGPGLGGTGTGSSLGGLGVTIRGGPPAQPGVIYLSSFGGAAPPENANVKVPLGPRHQPAVTIIATPRSGGGMATYGALAGARVYTTYLDTSAGSVVLQYAEKDATRPGYDGDLVAPDPLNLKLPQSIPIARLIVACTLDRNGVLRAFRILEASDTSLASRILAALAEWRFRPVLRQDMPIEVSAILGFHVGTQ